MTHANRNKIPARRRLTPFVDSLEVRALLNATATPHVDVQVTAKAEKPIHTAAHASKPVTTKAEKPIHTVAHASKPAHTATKPKPSVVKSKALSSVKLHPELVYAKTAHTTATVRGQTTYVPISTAKAPIQVQTAYGVGLLGISNEGQGQTIGIVDAFNDPNITTDANAFSTQYNLPNFNVTGGPTLTVAEDTMFGPVSNAVKGTNGDTTGETALDVEWAHAMAPKANILLVEVPAESFQALLHGVVYAANHGASVVSLSYGGSEIGTGLPTLYSSNLTYLATGPASTVAVTVSTGDNSYPSYPASSTSVIGVGGTALYLTGSNAYSSETAWGGIATNGAGGGGTTAFFKLPAFQSSAGINYGLYRNLPDVALLADPNTGVSVYNSYDSSVNGGDPWNQIGGTSLASPLFAGMISIVQEERVAASKPILTSVEINDALYAAYTNPTLYASLFHDVTLGSNAEPSTGAVGNPAGKGYDLATGLGSPIANALVPYLVSQ